MNPLLDELTQILRCRQRQFVDVRSADLLKERPEEAQAIYTGALRQSSGIEHVSIETTQFVFHRIGYTELYEDAGMFERVQQVPTRRMQLVTGSLHRLRAGASGKVPIEETLDIVLCQTPHDKRKRSIDSALAGDRRM